MRCDHSLRAAFPLVRLPPAGIEPTTQRFGKPLRNLRLTNLIHNALKYSDDDRFCRVTAVAQGDEVRISIIDHGVGIDAGSLPHIFDRFYQVDSSATRRFGGTGLGLAIVKEILERLGGSIEVHSTPGSGSVFRVVMPTGPGVETEPVAPSAAESEAGASIARSNAGVAGAM